MKIKHKYIIVAILALLIILPMFYLKTTEHLTNCTALNQDPYSSGSYVSCCEGEEVWENGKYKCVSCTKDQIESSKFTMCCSGLIQDTSRPGYVTCKSNQSSQKMIFVVRNGDKDETKRWSKESKTCIDCGYSMQPDCTISQSNNCEILTATLPSIREITYPHDVKNPNGNVIQYQNGTVITYYNVTLTDIGIAQSKSLETVLPKLALDIKAAPITKAIILEPLSRESSANSFQTILPFLVKNKIQKIQFFGSKTSDYNFINDINTMLDKNDGSIIIVGNAEVLWGSKSTTTSPLDNSILSILGKLNNITSIPYPEMGKTMYTFKPSMKVYDMVSSNSTYVAK